MKVSGGRWLQRRVEGDWPGVTCAADGDRGTTHTRAPPTPSRSSARCFTLSGHVSPHRERGPPSDRDFAGPRPRGSVHQRVGRTRGSSQTDRVQTHHSYPRRHRPAHGWVSRPNCGFHAPTASNEEAPTGEQVIDEIAVGFGSDWKNVEFASPPMGGDHHRRAWARAVLIWSHHLHKSLIGSNGEGFTHIQV